MWTFVWASMFLLLAIVGSTVALIGMGGMPISGAVQVAFFIMLVLVAGSGISLLGARMSARSV